jgi:hypothetical protein
MTDRVAIRCNPRRNCIQGLARLKRRIVSILLLIAVSLFGDSAHGQSKPSLSLDQVRQLLKIGAPDATIAHEIDSRGVEFQPSSALLSELEHEGAGALTLAALRKRVSPESTEQTPRAPASARVEEVSASLKVRHLHDGGWNSHVIELLLTGDAIDLSGSQHYAANSGVASYCIFPARIPLERIDTVEAKSDRFVNGLKIFSNTSNSHTILLHLDYRDDKGRKHGFDFISADARQWNNEWLGGDENAVRGFAAKVKSVATQRVRQSKSPPGNITEGNSIDARSPMAAQGIKRPDTNKAVQSGSGVVGLERSVETPVSYKAQMCWPTTCREVTVWPISPSDPTRLRVADDATGNLLVDIPRKEISKMTVRQQVIELRTPTPNQITLTLSAPFAHSQGPKVYQMCFRVPSQKGKQIFQCFISDLASCRLDAPCQEGQDGGRHILDLETRIKSANGTVSNEVN